MMKSKAVISIYKQILSFYLELFIILILIKFF